MAIDRTLARFLTIVAVMTPAAVTPAVAVPGLALAAGVGGPGSQTFVFTGQAAQFTVRSGTTFPIVVLEGAGGGAGKDAAGGDPVAGATGGFAAGNLDTTVAETVQVVVGGAGGAGSDTAGGAGGFNGGGAGGFDNVISAGGGGGGGATDIRMGGCVASLSCGNAQRLLVAGGGGGTAGGSGYEGPGGQGGGATGGDGGGEDDGTTGGGGGTDSAPGAGGVGGESNGIDGDAGVGAHGGAAGGDGGGGGGGYYGGGGGAQSTANNGSGGGGGSGYASPSLYLPALASGGGSTSGGTASFYWMTASAGAVLPGDPLTFTAHYPPLASGGTVTFDEGADPVCADVPVGVDGTASCTTSTLPEGSHSMNATYSALPAGSALLDSMLEGVYANVDGSPPPKPTATSTRTPVQLAGQVKFCYEGVDYGSGIASYDVRYTDAPWNAKPSALTYPAAWQDITAKCVSRSGTPGHEYCFAARATDNLGHTGAWSTPWCRALPLDDFRLAVASGDWKRDAGKVFYKHNVTTAVDAGATLKLAGAHVHRVALVVTKCPTCGTLKVIIGGDTFTVRTHAATRANKVIVLLAAVQRQVVTVKIKAKTNDLVFVDGLAVIQS